MFTGHLCFLLCNNIHSLGDTKAFSSIYDIKTFLPTLLSFNFYLLIGKFKISKWRPAQHCICSGWSFKHHNFKSWSLNENSGLVCFFIFALCLFPPQQYAWYSWSRKTLELARHVPTVETWTGSELTWTSYFHVDGEDDSVPLRAVNRESYLCLFFWSIVSLQSCDSSCYTVSVWLTVWLKFYN